MTHRCEHCQKEFASTDAQAMHQKAKHPETVKKQIFASSGAQKRKVRNWLIVLVVLGLMIWGWSALRAREERTAANLPPGFPTGPVHWHPHLTILVDNVSVSIPSGIGITIGNLKDVALGMDAGMAPTHTHEGDGTIHLENKNPRARPESLTLGYFFETWGETFNENCILEHCTDKGNLTMKVNGKESTEFGKYLMHDGDKIVITYTSQKRAG